MKSNATKWQITKVGTYFFEPLNISIKFKRLTSKLSER